jgi:hypothetical protein
MRIYSQEEITFTEGDYIHWRRITGGEYLHRRRIHSPEEITSNG